LVAHSGCGALLRLRPLSCSLAWSILVGVGFVGFPRWILIYGWWPLGALPVRIGVWSSFRGDAASGLYHPFSLKAGLVTLVLW